MQSLAYFRSQLINDDANNKLKCNLSMHIRNKLNEWITALQGVKFEFK